MAKLIKNIDWTLLINILLTVCLIPIIAWAHGVDQQVTVQQGEIDTINAVHASQYEDLKGDLSTIKDQLDKIEDRLNK